MSLGLHIIIPNWERISWPQKFTGRPGITYGWIFPECPSSFFQMSGNCAFLGMELWPRPWRWVRVASTGHVFGLIEALMISSCADEARASFFHLMLKLKWAYLWIWPESKRHQRSQDHLWVSFFLGTYVRQKKQLGNSLTSINNAQGIWEGGKNKNLPLKVIINNSWKNM